MCGNPSPEIRECPALEASEDVDVLQSLSLCFPKGCRLECTVMDKSCVSSKLFKKKGDNGVGDQNATGHFVNVSLLAGDKVVKPAISSLVAGRVNHHLRATDPPSLMLDLRGGYAGRCCITELEEVDDWANMPMGRQNRKERTASIESEENKDASPMSTDSDM